MDFSYKFNAVKGQQANQPFYIAMVPLKYLGRMFPDDLDLVTPEHRAQRKLNMLRIPDMTEYICENRSTYVFSALAASIDGDFSFNAFGKDDSIGVLEIDMAAKLLINDGQHRKAAILEALKEDDSLEQESISIVFYKDSGLSRAQQMFSDLNKHAVKPSNSLSALYDVRSRLSSLVRKIVDEIPFFKKYIELESDSLGVNSPKFFTLNYLKNAMEKMLKGVPEEDYDDEFVLDYWREVIKNITEWDLVERREMTKKCLKENYIITLGVTLKAFGRLGSHYYSIKDNKFRELSKLADIDWLRTHKQWQSRTIREDGKVVSSDQAVALTCNKIKELIGIELTKEDKKREVK